MYGKCSQTVKASVQAAASLSAPLARPHPARVGLRVPSAAAGSAWPGRPGESGARHRAGEAVWLPRAAGRSVGPSWRLRSGVRRHRILLFCWGWAGFIQWVPRVCGARWVRAVNRCRIFPFSDVFVFLCENPRGRPQVHLQELPRPAEARHGLHRGSPPALGSVSPRTARPRSWAVPVSKASAVATTTLS